MTPYIFQSGTIINLDHVERIVFDDTPLKNLPFQIGFTFTTDPTRLVWDNHKTKDTFDVSRTYLQNIGKPPEIKLNPFYTSNPSTGTPV